jgi:toxin FitB
LTFAEIRRGIELLPAGKRRSQLAEWHNDIQASFAARLLPVTMPIADRWATLSAEAQRRGTPLAIMDGLIAATPLQHQLTVVARNLKDFGGFGVALLNPWEA